MGLTPTRVALSALTIAALVAAGCGGDDESLGDSPTDDESAASDETSGSGSGAEASESGAAGETLNVGVVLAGPRNDRAFYQSYHDGVVQAQETFDIEMAVVDNVDTPEKATDALTNLATDNELIIAGGSALVPAGNTVAPQFPDTTFVMSGVVDPGVDNLHTYATRQGVPAYVAGVLAAEMTESGTVGYVGGADIPPNSESEIDFRAGAQSVDPEIEVASVTIGSFSDAPKSKEAAAAQIADEADVIYAFLDAGLPGVLDAIDESGEDVKVFNPTTDRCEESPQLAGYAYQNTVAMVDQIVNDFYDDELPAEPRFFALEDPDVQALRLCPDYSEHQATVDSVTDAINSGEVELPEGG